jgi:hypothetical protein
MDFSHSVLAKRVQKPSISHFMECNLIHVQFNIDNQQAFCDPKQFQNEISITTGAKTVWCGERGNNFN